MKSSFGKSFDSLKIEIHPTVFGASAVTIIGLMILILLNLESSRQVMDSVQTALSHNMGWVFITFVNMFLILVVYLMFSRFGDLRIGGRDSVPEFTYWGWFAMLFSAGMGIGLLFYSVAEPMLHFAEPPTGIGGSSNPVQRAEMAMAVTFFHWGLHTWGIYGLVGLSLAFFAFSKGLPLTIRSAFHPLLGRKADGPIGNVIDVLAVFATLVGLATSLGVGVQQINAGLHHLFGIEKDPWIQALLVVVITAAATWSVVNGLDKGIRRLSELNMSLGFILMIFVLLLGPTVFILDSIVQNIGFYGQNFIQLSTWTEAYRLTDWQNDWTIFYWSWWISWSPFVGMFIARISKGRTVREFCAGVLLVPTLITFIWVGVFGGAALHSELYGMGGIAEAVQKDIAVALFILLEQYPLSSVTSLLGIVVVTSFFVTSSDSGSLVIDTITSGGTTEAPVKQRVFWAITQGALAAVLLFAGGLDALQAAAILAGLPFAFILLAMTFSLIRGLEHERKLQTKIDESSSSPSLITSS
jgi:choline/glycine/proline betaine transport protein